MSEFTGVDPLRLRELANALQGLADALDADGTTIRNLFSKWEGTLGQSVLTQQTTQVGDDAHNMALRASLAYSLLLQPRFTSANSPHSNWVNIQWDVSQIDTALEGQREAMSLLEALDDPDDPQSRATIQMLSQSLEDHADDPAYLQAFMNSGGLDASVRAARFLHDQDGTHGSTVLSSDSQEILASFGLAVQSATSLAEQGEIQLPANYLDKLTSPPNGDMWSVGMLFQYGPNGDKWDPKVLSTVGGAMLDWRSGQEMRPNYSEPTILGTGYVPGGYVESDNPWYDNLGLDVSYLTVGADDAADRIQAIAANDPSVILMQSVSENPDASRLLLTGPDGDDHAKVLVDEKWHTPGPQSFNEAQWLTAVITAATSDRTGHPTESVEAAANVINAGAAEYGDEKNKSEYDKSQYPVPGQITHALAQVFATYVPDFAQSHGMPEGQAAAPATGADNAGDADRRTRDSAEFHQHDRAEQRRRRTPGQLRQRADLPDGRDGNGISRGADLPEQPGRAARRGDRHAHQTGLDAEKLTDEANKTTVLWVDSVGGAITSIPGLPPGAEWVQTLITAGLPAVKESFSTDNAQKYQEGAGSKFYDDQSSMRLPLVQGLVLSGQIEPPENHPEWANGQITLDDAGDRTDFNSWWQQLAGQPDLHLDDFDDEMRDAFERGNSAN